MLKLGLRDAWRTKASPVALLPKSPIGSCLQATWKEKIGFPKSVASPTRFSPPRSAVLARSYSSRNPQEKPSDIRSHPYDPIAEQSKPMEAKERILRSPLIKHLIADKEPGSSGSRASDDSAKAVSFALVGNIINTTGKFLAFLATEFLHSLADVGNQSLLYIGIKRSSRPPTADHPYGFEGERFVYALISSVGMFFLGAGFSVVHGVYHLIHPGEIEEIWMGLAMLSFSGIIELATFSRGMLAVRRGAIEAEMGFLEFVKKGPDPMGVAVIMEDGAALLGISIGLACLGLTYYTGNPTFDAIGSVLIGSLLGTFAMFLINKNARALVSPTAPPAKRQMIVNALLADPMVQSLHHVKAIQLGANSISFKAEIEFDGPVVAKKYFDLRPNIIKDIQLNHEKPEVLEKILIEYASSVVEGLGDEVDRIEKMITQKDPDVKFVDLESN